VVCSYFKALPLAGKIITPSAVWITIANALVFNIWLLNGKEPFYPAKLSASSDSA